ncbi:13E12 repeat family protein [Protaetiibacter mangrovi]|uniref:13E12 repeat family protein n=1 Tax=Protaetiibacter mangrovi TaxID=2970926 RepID=A0ABT1ZIC5_9MICO|nr:13E12 repeat family protein [Protaetiibacter mangrovi]MCS0500335.1 13E12 repeat family protein [Protaetiibacter mangrovi]
MASITDSLARVGDLSVPFAPVSVAGLGDAELLVSQRWIAEVRRRLDAVAATVAGEIAHRSRRELGHAGLAQSEGVRTAEELIAKVSGTSTRDARTLVKAAELLSVDRPTMPEAPPVPRWQRLIGDAVAAATISVEAAELIRARLTAAAQGTTGDVLEEAVGQLLREAPGLTIEQLAIRAGRVRDELDLAGIAARERELHQKRFLRVSPQLDGMTRVTGLLDPESAVIVVPILDAATSPRRGGPRFVDPDAIERAEDIMRDERSTEQLALDTFVDLLRAGAQVDPNRLLGDRKPAVRILVTKTTSTPGWVPRSSKGRARRCRSTRRSGSSAAPAPSRSCSTETAKRSTWGGNSDCSRRSNGPRWPPGMAGA